MNLNQVTVAATDIPRSLAFYQTLGLKLIVSAAHYARFECPDGDATFSIHAADSMPPAGGTVIYFECAELDAQVAALQSKGVEFDTPPTDQRWRWREARLRDPDGNVLCLFHAGIDRKHPPWRLPAAE